MSVFIQINQATIDEDAVPAKILLNIKSKDTQLCIGPLNASQRTLINHSVISSIKQKSLSFILTPIDNSGNSSYTLTNELSFSPLYFSAEKDIDQKLWFGNNIRVNLSIFFTKKKNFLGPIQFYQNESTSKNISPIHQQLIAQLVPAIIPLETNKHFSSNRENDEPVAYQSEAPGVKLQGKNGKKNDEKNEKPKSKGFFFCCGNDTDDKKYEVEDFDDRVVQKQSDLKKDATFPNQLKKQEGKDVQFYKGPCKSKNMFSICDAPVNDNKYTVIEDHYKQRKQ